MKKWILAIIIPVVLVTGVIAGVVLTKVPDIIREEKNEIHSAGKTEKKNVVLESANENEFIGEEKAKEIALGKAELNESDVSYITVQLDRDNGIWQYEVEFKEGLKEYSADIRATDGKILEWDVELD